MLHSHQLFRGMVFLCVARAQTALLAVLPAFASASLAGTPQRELLQERAELLYGKAKFKPLETKQTAADGKTAVTAVPAGAASA